MSSTRLRCCLRSGGSRSPAAGEIADGSRRSRRSSEFRTGSNFSASLRIRATLRDLYRRASVLALPSAYEGLPMVLLEAMSCATPVEVATISAIAEVIDTRPHGATRPRRGPGSPCRLRSSERLNARTLLGQAARAEVLACYDQATVRPDLVHTPERGEGGSLARKGGGRMTRRWKHATRALSLAAAAPANVGTAHLLLLLGAAICGRTRVAGDHRGVRFAVVIPAHNEEADIAAAVGSVQRSAYPQRMRRTIVVADNCTDRTAEVARRAGAEVWERIDSIRRGKGHALAWAFGKLLP